MRLLLAAAVAMAMGVGIGMIPFVNEHLHWNLWVIVPISGLVLGGLLSVVQFLVLRGLRAKLTTFGIVFLTLTGGLAYFATDYGIYRSLTVPVERGSEQKVRLCDFVSFGDYLSVRTGSSSVGSFSLRHRMHFDVGRVGTTITYVADLAGALLGAGMVLMGCSGSSPYCDRCSRYKSHSGDLERGLPDAPEEAEAWLQQCRRLIAQGSYRDLVAQARALPAVTTETRMKISLNESFCSTCGRGTLWGYVYRRRSEPEQGWDVLPEHDIRLESDPGEAPQLEAARVGAAST